MGPRQTVPVAPSAKALVVAFAAGFLAVLIVHQPVLAMLDASGFAKAATYSMDATRPFGVPRVLSLAFWGGIWGVLLLYVQRSFPGGAAYWIAACAFGAIFPTLVAWTLVPALKGHAVGAGFNAHRLITGLLINGAWGWGTALFLHIGMRTLRSPPRSSA